MMGGSEAVSGDKDGVPTTAIHVPIGWQRRVEGGQVIYVSPSGTALSSVDEVKTYLLNDGTCKCGLECPLVIHKVFNFTVGVKVEQHSQPLSKAEQDMTKLCNHRRKVVAMAALCRSMQSSQLPFANLHYPELNSGVDGRNPKGTLTEWEEKDQRIHSPKLHQAPAQAHSTLPPNPCASPKSPLHFVFPYNGSSPVLQAQTNSHHPLEALRRLHQPPPVSTPSCLLSNSTLTANSTAQRSPQSSCQGQRTPQTPETPSSPLLGSLSSPPPSSPMAIVGGGRGSHIGTPHPHGVIVGGSPISSPSLSPSVLNMSCLSPHKRSRHPSASPTALCEGGGSAGAGVGLMGSNLCQRKKSTSSSSPQSPLHGGSPKPGHNVPMYKLDEILEQFKNSGNSSTNNHHLLLPTNPTSLTNQSSISNPHALPSKASKRVRSDASRSGPQGYELNTGGSSGLALSPLFNHLQSHPSRLPHPPSFPASSLLSAAAKAQMANQITQGQTSSVSTDPVSLPSSLELLKEAQQQQQPSSKVTISTLHNSHPSSSPASVRPPHHSLASASSVRFPPSHSLAPSRPPTLPHLPPAAERGASYRKRQRRSPTVLPQRDRELANGLPKTPPGDAGSGAALNLSSSTSFSSHSSSTSAVHNQNALALENHHHPLPGLLPRLPTSRQLTQLSRPPRPSEALDFTTYLTPTPLSLDPPTQPLSALLHLLSVQNAQAAASASSAASAQPGSVSSEGGGHTNKSSPRLSPSSPSSRANARQRQTQSPCLNTNPLPLAQPPTSHFRSMRSPTHPPSDQCSPLRRLSLSPIAQPNSQLINSRNASQHSSLAPSDKHQLAERPGPATGSVSLPPQEALAQDNTAGEASPNGAPTSAEMSHSQGSVSVATSSSPKPLDLSNHVLALLAASSSAVPQGEASTSDRNTDAEMSSQESHAAGPEEPRCEDPMVSMTTKSLEPTSPTSSLSSRPGENHLQQTPPVVADPISPLPLAEAFPFMNQEQLLQLLSSTGGLPSLLDPAVLASLPLGGLWMGGQHAHIPPGTTAQNLAEQQQSESQQQLLIQQPGAPEQSQDQQQKQQQVNSNPVFPLLPLLSGAQGELPLNLMGLLPTLATTSTHGQEGDFGLEKPSLQALLMASLLLGQQQTSLLSLSGLGQLSQVNLEVPLQPPQQIPNTLDGLALDKTSGLLDPSSLPSPGLLEVAQGLLSLPPASEGSSQALQSLLLPAALPPPPAAFLPLSPALLTAALNAAELHPSPHTQLAPTPQTQHTQPQVSDAGVDTLIPLSLQGKDNTILQQLLPTLLNPAVLGELSALTGLQNMFGVGAGSILLPPVQTSALGMPLLQGPDGAINLINNIQLNIAAPSEGEKPVSLQEAQSPTSQENIPATQVAAEMVPNPAPAPPPAPPRESTLPLQRAAEGRPVIDPYTSFMDTIYTSFLQVNAKEQEDGAYLSPSDPTSPFCALTPVSFHAEHQPPPTPVTNLPQASAPVSLSPRRACSLRNPDLSRLNLEAVAHSPAQGTPKPSEEGSTPPLQRKPVMVEGHTHTDPPLPPPYLEEAKTDCTGPAAALCPFGELGLDRKGHLPHTGYLSPRDGRSNEETAGTILHSEQGRDQGEAVGAVRKGRKRKQTLQNVLEDFRDMDAIALEEPMATSVLLKPERSVRGRRRRGARSQQQ